MDSRIKEKRRNLNRKELRPAWFLGLAFGWAILWSLTPLFCVGAEKGSKSVPFSLSASNERLDAVLEKISKASGYTITVNEGWRNRAITVHLENVTVEEGLKTLIDALRPSHLLWRSNAEKDRHCYDPGCVRSFRFLGKVGTTTEAPEANRPLEPGADEPSGEAYPQENQAAGSPASDCTRRSPGTWAGGDPGGSTRG
jgi:hypothetical protein